MKVATKRFSMPEAFGNRFAPPEAEFLSITPLILSLQAARVNATKRPIKLRSP
jgi:hypothetical protein